MILLLTTSLVAAGISSYITSFIWEAKFTKLELTVERDKSKELARIQAEQVTSYQKVISDYNATVDKVAHIIDVRNAEVEASNQKYRNLYAAYSRLQQSAPSEAACYVPTARADLLMRSVEQANETRTRLVAPATKTGTRTS